MSCRGHHSNAEITSKNTYCAFCCPCCRLYAGKVLKFFFLLLYCGEAIKTKLKFGCSFSISLTFVLEIFCDFCANCAVKHSVTSRPCFVPPSEHINGPIRASALSLHGFFRTNIVTSFQLAC